MFKKVSIKSVMLLIALTLIVGGCGGGCPNPDQQASQNAPEGPAPDYKSIDAGLMDASQIVRMQSAQTLANVKHSSAIPKLIQVVKDNKTDMDIVNVAVKGLISQGERCVEPVRAGLWEDKDLVSQYAGLKVLSGVLKKEVFIPEAVEKFYNVPFSEESKQLRKEIATFVLNNTDKNNNKIMADIVSFIQDDDPAVSTLAAVTLSEWKDPKVVKNLIDLYYIKRENPDVVRSILDVLVAYPAPDPAKSQELSLSDITVFLETFGSYDRRIEDASYQGLKNFAYNDKDGKIVNYIRRFSQCDDDNVRAHVVDLVQIISTKQWPANIPVPTFEIPSNKTREGYCK